ncbi:hypothetical protein NHX12_009205 [Muraenolepis orangiensis]|uniref:Uncharacterized protein n=1 Tax=Muraenolepis orangiensis TaxID=630683 RepID=A0A9Q0DL28_9TELE|nr:hypothetical protein NHX12_009205 [Muraenolepis orangiensis]
MAVRVVTSQGSPRLDVRAVPGWTSGQSQAGRQGSPRLDVRAVPGWTSGQSQAGRQGSPRLDVRAVPGWTSVAVPQSLRYTSGGNSRRTAGCRLYSSGT